MRINLLSECLSDKIREIQARNTDTQYGQEEGRGARGERGSPRLPVRTRKNSK